MMRLTRVYRFAASHRLHSTTLSEAENAALYGKCNNPFGHGHNYVLHVSISGVVDEPTGRVIDIGALDRFIQGEIVEAFDHRDMNHDVHDFQSMVPTTENLAIAIERRLRKHWDTRFEHAELDRIRIEETARNTFELRIA
jgi:6-pyruvoyltetrahydropterin/6-carboxytetrahydropterin synthase